MPRLLTALRDELVTAGIARDPSTAGSLPPFWRAPQLGTPAPGEGNNPTEVGADAVIGAYMTGGTAPGPYAKWSMYPNVELRFRTTKGYLAEDLEQAISLRIIDRRDFTLGGTLQVIECLQAIPLQLLRADEQGFEHLCTYSFQILRPGYTGFG